MTKGSIPKLTKERSHAAAKIKIIVAIIQPIIWNKIPTFYDIACRIDYISDEKVDSILLGLLFA
jgi:hypothetical protein